MPNMRRWSLYCKESYWLAEFAYSLGYGLACYTVSHGVLVTPGMFSLDVDPNCFSQERMSRKQVREYRDLGEKVHNFNKSWK